jgi:energy-coupling factor transport system permease protein
MKQADSFSSYHPLVSLLFFVLAIGFTMFIAHPLCLAVSLTASLAYSVYLNRGKAVRFNLLFMLPMILITATINPLVNHQGMTILVYLEDGNPLTLESILFGVVAALTLVAVISWFSCFNSVMTTDKFVYLFGRIIPSLSMVLAMALRLVPRYKAQLKLISEGQRCIGRDLASGGLLRRIRTGLRILSIMVTWALENGIETADSMKSRGYGLPHRTAFSLFILCKRDYLALAALAGLGALIVADIAIGGLEFYYFPDIHGQFITPRTIAFAVCFTVLCYMPLYINVRERMLWKRSLSKI